MTLDLPSLESLHGVDLDIGITEVRLLLPGYSESLLIPLPPELPCSPGVPTAKFSRKRKQLTLTWEIAEGQPCAEVQPTASDTANGESGDCRTDVTTTLPEKKDSQREAYECLEMVQDEVEHILKQCTVTKLKAIAAIGGSSVLLSDFSVEGSANIKERCCDFRVRIWFKWEVLDAFGGFLGATGHGEVLDLTPDQASPKVVIKVSGGGSSIAKAAGEWMKRQGAGLVSESLNGQQLSVAILSAWDDMVASEKSEAAALLEKKPLKEWAEEWFVQKLSGMNVKLFGGSAHATFASPKVSGEFSVSMQQGKPIVAFQVRLECSWTIVMSGNQSEGTLVVPEFASVTGSDRVEVSVEATPGKKKASGQLLTGLRQTGVSAVRTLLAQFSNEVQLQVQS